MTQVSEGRAQDQGRSHRKRGDPSPATRDRLDRWYDTLRAELDSVIAQLTAVSDQTTLDGIAPPAIPLDDARRDRYISRGVTIARELGAEVDVRGTEGDA